MNEFNAQTGGRYVYVEDVLNLQDLALAFGRIFDECDNFIISGCEVSGSTISSGYVYLNGKVRYFSGASGITTWPQYMYENNSTESVHYASGNTKVGRNIYGVSIGSAVPTSVDALTGKTPVSMTITQNGGTLMKDAFFGKYALVLNSASLSQVLSGALKIDGDLDVTGSIRSIKNHYRITETQATFDTAFNNGDLYVKTQYDSGNNSYTMSMENGNGFTFYINDTLAAKIKTDGMSLPGSVSASLGIFGGVATSNSGIYNHTDATDTGSVNINMVGYNGETQYFRNTTIGNGKGSAVVSVDGQTQSVNIAGVITIASGTSTEGVVLMLNKPKTSADLRKSIVWKDSNSAIIGSLGYTDSENATFSITNNLAGVYMYGATNSFVDLGPAIKENGQALTDKYVQIVNFDETIATVAKVADVYTKTQSDTRYPIISDGFSGFVNGGVEKSTLRKQIDAVSVSDLDNYAKKTSYLSDMATSESAKKQIRTNIGAAGTDEFQAKLKDTGWVRIGTAALYVRQIGNIVSIQGEVKTIHEGELFRIPNTIDPPTYSVYKSFGFTTGAHIKSWSVGIAANTRVVSVENCQSGCNITTKFSLTYMV